MFNMRKNYTLKFAGKHYEAIMAILKILNIKDKGVEASENRDGIWKIVFKANNKELTDLCAKLDKYNIGKAYI